MVEQLKIMKCLKLFWPKPIAKVLTKLYQNSEKSNNE